MPAALAQTHHIPQSLARIKNQEAGSEAARTEGVITYLHNDHLGSAAAMTTQSGSVLRVQRYTPFGEEWNTLAANDNQAGFTGHIKDAATGLNYMQARYYDPVFGRFLSVDPVKFLDTGNPVHFGRYAYADNDPINMLDPLGMQAHSIAMRDEDNASDQASFMARAEATADAGNAVQVGNGDDMVTAMEGMGNIDSLNVFSHGTSDGLIGADGSATGNEGFYTQFNSNDDPGAAYVTNFADSVGNTPII